MMESQAYGGVMDQANVYGHSRSRTTSSNIFPSQQQQQHQQQQQQQQQTHYQYQQHPPMPQNPAQHQMLQQPGSNFNFSRRSPSVNTLSTASSMQPPAAYRTSSHSDLRRSISSRSGGASTVQQPTSYVALLRKQKATVWCDRAQYEDPRLAAQQKAAKMRANLEVVGGPRPYGVAGTGRTTTGISTTGKVAAKIRHHGKTPVIGFAPGENHVGVGGVPMRLTATEVEGESDEEDDAHTMAHTNRRRAGSSGRNSIGSNHPSLTYRSSGGQGSLSGRRRSPTETPERTTSMASQRRESWAKADDNASGRAQSAGSGSSAERADNVGELQPAPRLASNSLMHSALTREKSVKSPEELKRRGSVDERTVTLTSGRLFIANPD